MTRFCVCVAVGALVGVLVVAPLAAFAWVSTRDTNIDF